MSLELGNSPGKPLIKTWGDDMVYLSTGSPGGLKMIEITKADFMAAAYYVLTNAQLEEDDPRRKFIDIVKKMELSSDNLHFMYQGIGCLSLVYPGNYEGG